MGMTTRNLENPLFDEYVEAMTPTVQRHLAWHERWAKEHGTSTGDHSSITWEIGNSTYALTAMLKALEGAPDRTEQELEEIEYIMSPFRIRRELVKKYAWAIPTPEAIDKCVEHSPNGIVEIGAGGGYWAKLLRESGLEVAAFDTAPHSNHHVEGEWSEVRYGGPKKAARFPERTLFLCWPPYDTPMARNTLRAFTGEKFIFIGEDDGGCTGNAAFFKLLAREWEELEYVPLPQWPGIHDGLTVYRRLGS